MHAHGKTGVVDKEEARKWLKIAAEGGAVKAQMFLAQMSTFGRGGYEKDESVAFEYLTRAADQGNAHATHQLGVRYLYAVGVEQDLDKAIEHFDKAIELGSADAVKDREIAQKKKKMSFTRGIKKQISGLPMIGRSKSKRNTVESSLRIKAASAPLKSPSSSRQTSRQSTPAQSPVASPTSQPQFEEEEAVPSPTAGAKRPAPAAAAAAAKRPAIREPRRAPRPRRPRRRRARLRRARGHVGGAAGGGGPGARSGSSPSPTAPSSCSASGWRSPPSTSMASGGLFE